MCHLTDPRSARVSSRRCTASSTSRRRGPNSAEERIPKGGQGGALSIGARFWNDFRTCGGSGAGPCGVVCTRQTGPLFACLLSQGGALVRSGEEPVPHLVGHAGRSSDCYGERGLDDARCVTSSATPSADRIATQRLLSRRASDEAGPPLHRSRAARCGPSVRADG